MIVPDLQSSLLCDDVRQERNGKFILIGLFDVIGVPNFPVVFQRMCIVNRWCCGEGEFVQQSRIVKPDGGKPVVQGQAVKITLSDQEATATSVEFFMNVVFEAEGAYWIEILLDGDLKVRYPLKARRVAPPSPSSRTPDVPSHS